MGWLWWLAAVLLLIAIEVVTVDLVLLMFAGGAFAAGIAAALGAPFPVQVITFCVVSVLLLVSLRPWLLRRLRDRTPLIETNVAAQVGRLALVVQPVDARGGRVKVSGEVWSARSARPGAVYPVDTELRVVRIDGATAVVDEVAVAAPQPDAPTVDAKPARPSLRDRYSRARRSEENA